MNIDLLSAPVGLLVLALGVSGCGGPQPCPEVDEEELAERVAEIVIERLEAEGRGAGDRDRIAGRIEAPEPEAPEPEVDLDEDEEEEDAPEVFHVPVGDSPSLGADDALVTIVMFADIQCAFCARAYQTVKAVRDRFGDQARIVWKNNPLPFHDEAMQAHQALMEAHAQKGDKAAFAMLELMFEDLTRLELEDLERHARTLKLSLPRFRRAIRNKKHSAAIAHDLELSGRLGIRGTPTFFINGVKVVGAGSYYTYFHTVSDALERAEELLRSGVPRNRIYDDTIRDGRGRPQER